MDNKMASVMHLLTQAQKKAINFSSEEIQHFHSLEYIIPQYGVDISFLKSQDFQASDNEIIETYNSSHSSFSIQELLQNWVLNSSAMLSILLGDYGMGKTISCLTLTSWLLKNNSVELPVPIYLDLRYISDKEHIYSFSIHLILDSILKGSRSAGKTQYGVLSSKEIINLVQYEGALIIFDGLDEVLVHMSRDQGKQFVHTILDIIPIEIRNKKLEKLGRVLMSCRTHFFKSTQDQHSFLLEQRADIAKQGEDYHIFVMCPLAESQIKNYLQHLVPDIDIETLLLLIRSVHNLVELSQRPYTLSLIPHLIPYIKQWNKEGSLVKGVTIYRHLVLSLLERDAGKHEILSEHKIKLMECFAADLWRSGKDAWTAQYLEEWFVEWIKAQNEIHVHYIQDHSMEETKTSVIEILLDDLIVATLLIRIGDSHFRFSHTSLLEFFLASYMHSSLVKNQINDWELPLVSKETLDFLGQLLSEDINDAALNTLREMLNVYRPKISELAFFYLVNAHVKSFPIPSLKQIHLEGANLKNWHIRGAENNILNLENIFFQKANLQGADFHHVNLRAADFSDAKCSNMEINVSQAESICFKNTDLKFGFFIDVNFKNANFSGTKIDKRGWIRCNLENVQGLDIEDIPHTSIFDFCVPHTKFNFEHRFLNDQKHNNTHQGVVPTCIFTSTGQKIVSASIDGTVRIWNVKTREYVQLLKHSHSLYSCALSANEKYICSASFDNNLYVWDVNSGSCLNVLKGHVKGVRNCAFSPDNKWCVSVSNDQTVRLWEIDSGECIKVLKAHETYIGDCKFSPLNNRFASASDDGQIYIWDCISDKSLMCLSGHKENVRSIAFSRDGQKIISASGDKTIRIWEVETGQCLKVLYGHTDKVRTCAVSPDNQYIVSSGFDKTIRIWDIETGECIKVLQGHEERVRGCDISVDGIIASSSDDLTIRLWDSVSGECIGVIG